MRVTQVQDGLDAADLDLIERRLLAEIRSSADGEGGAADEEGLLTGPGLEVEVGPGAPPSSSGGVAADSAKLRGPTTPPPTDPGAAARAGIEAQFQGDPRLSVFGDFHRAILHVVGDMVRAGVVDPQNGVLLLAAQRAAGLQIQGPSSAVRAR